MFIPPSIGSTVPDSIEERSISNFFVFCFLNTNFNQHDVMYNWIRNRDGAIVATTGFLNFPGVITLDIAGSYTCQTSHFIHSAPSSVTVEIVITMVPSKLLLNFPPPLPSLLQPLIFCLVYLSMDKMPTNYCFC